MHNINETIIENICACVREKAKNPISSAEMVLNVKLEHLLMRRYLDDPGAYYANCREWLQPLVPECRLDDAIVRKRAESMRLTERAVRTELVSWAHAVCDLLIAAMGGYRGALSKAQELLKAPYSSDRGMHMVQTELVLNDLFLRVPQLADREERDLLFKLGRRYSRACMNAIVNSIEYDLDLAADRDPLADLSPEELRREVYLARKELEEYRGLVEAADREFEDKLGERIGQEMQSFYAALNNEKYGFLIDSLYLGKRACMEARLAGESVPYCMQGIPVTIDRMLQFLRDSGVAPAGKLTPHSTHQMRLSDMEGCRFEPHPDRTAPIDPDEVVTVKVQSCGWKKGDIVFSYPVLQEWNG